MADTIFALSTLAGKSGIAVVRLSGPKCLDALKLLGADIKQPRRATLKKLIDPFEQDVIDQALLIYFKSPHSFTGEDVIEIQFHGSLASIDHILETLGKIDFLRMAEPGEFAKRAFINSKLDLTQAEGLADLIDSETRLQKKIALRQLDGDLGNLYSKWRTELISHLSKLEALIDFPEDDIPEDLINSIKDELTILAATIKRHLADNNKGEILRRGLNIAIVGEPNVGKSSLLNALAKSDVAIVSDIAGTTRDVISVRVELAGYPVTLYDTAGIRETQDIIEKEGVVRAIKTLEKSDIQLVVLDASNPALSKEIKELVSPDKPTFLVYNKIDLISSAEKTTAKTLGISAQTIELSTKFDDSVAAFLELLSSVIKANYTVSSEPILTHHRYRENLRKCLLNIENFDIMQTLDISAEYIRQAAVELGKITGKIDVEEILDEIFSSFCIGK